MWPVSEAFWGFSDLCLCNSASGSRGKKARGTRDISECGGIAPRAWLVLACSAMLRLKSAQGQKVGALASKAAGHSFWQNSSHNKGFSSPITSTEVAPEEVLKGVQ